MSSAASTLHKRGRKVGPKPYRAPLPCAHRWSDWAPWAARGKNFSGVQGLQRECSTCGLIEGCVE